jgi:ABC-2 type transport system permease protein
MILAGWQLAVPDVRAAMAFEWMLAWRRRRQRGTILVGLLPILFASIVVLLKSLGIIPVLSVDILPGVMALGYLPVFLVVVPLLLGTSLVGREAEAGTLTFLLVRPISRASLLLGKFVGAWAVACVLLCGSLLVVNVILLGADGFRDAGLALRVIPGNLGVLCLGALAYAALFTLVGLVSSRPALVGLFVAFVWEVGIPVLPGTIRNFTIRHHLVGLLPGDSIPAYARLTLQPPDAPIALLWLLGGSAMMLLLSIAIFTRRDYP